MKASLNLNRLTEITMGMSHDQVQERLGGSWKGALGWGLLAVWFLVGGLLEGGPLAGGSWQGGSWLGVSNILVEDRFHSKDVYKRNKIKETETTQVRLVSEISKPGPVSWDWSVELVSGTGQ